MYYPFKGIDSITRADISDYEYHVFTQEIHIFPYVETYNYLLKKCWNHYVNLDLTYITINTPTHEFLSDGHVYTNERSSYFRRFTHKLLYARTLYTTTDEEILNDVYNKMSQYYYCRKPKYLYILDIDYTSLGIGHRFVPVIPITEMFKPTSTKTALNNDVYPTGWLNGSVGSIKALSFDNLYTEGQSLAKGFMDVVETGYKDDITRPDYKVVRRSGLNFNETIATTLTTKLLYITIPIYSQIKPYTREIDGEDYTSDRVFTTFQSFYLPYRKELTCCEKLCGFKITEE